MENFSYTSIPNVKDTNLTVKSFLAKPSPIPSAVTFTLGVTGNIIAIFFLFKASKSHKWNVFYRFVTALAMTDLFGILTTSPVAFAVYDNDLVWVGGQPLCHYLSFMLTFAGVATVVFVGAMALDRYLAITFPFKYSQWNKDTIVNIIIVGIWIGSVLVACLPLVGLGHNIKQFPGTWCFFNFFGNTIEDQIFSYFYASIGLGVILMTAILNILVIVALTHGKRSHARRGSISSKSARARTDIYITVFLVAIFATFAICWTPFMIRIIINSTGVIKIDRRTDLITLRLATLNQILDPWVYILFRREVLVKITKFIRKRKRRKGSFLVRLASFTSSFKSHVSDPEQMGNLDKEKQNEDVITPLQEDIKRSQDGDMPPQDDIKRSQDVDKPLLDDIKRSQDDDKPSHEDIVLSHDDDKPQQDDIKLSQDDDKPSQDDIKGSQDDEKPLLDDIKLSEDSDKSSQDDLKLSQDDDKPSQDDRKLSQDDDKPSQDNIKLSQDGDKPPQDNIKLSQDDDKHLQDDLKTSQNDINKLTVDINSSHQDQNGLTKLSQEDLKLLTVDIISSHQDQNGVTKLSQEDIKQLTVDINSSHQDHNGQANTTDNQINVDEAFTPTNNIE
ncbi:histamine H2 receptor-like [Mytilus trossulus]|uniref:histamine H2 receptor-like n=1 Tax=Mytilus trossulus TaxID=6551 RepID=UPI0030073652